VNKEGNKEVRKIESGKVFTGINIDVKAATEILIFPHEPIKH